MPTWRALPDAPACRASFLQPHPSRARVRAETLAFGERGRDAAELVRGRARHFDEARALLEVVHAEGRGKARAARGGQHVVRSRAVVAERLGTVLTEEDGARVAKLAE